MNSNKTHHVSSKPRDSRDRVGQTSLQIFKARLKYQKRRIQTTTEENLHLKVGRNRWDREANNYSRSVQSRHVQIQWRELKSYWSLGLEIILCECDEMGLHGFNICDRDSRVMAVGTHCN